MYSIRKISLAFMTIQKLEKRIEKLFDMNQYRTSRILQDNRHKSEY